MQSGQVLNTLKQLGILLAAVLLLGTMVPMANATDWMHPFKQLISPTEAADRDAARAEHKARELEREAAKVQAEAEEARLKAEKAQKKARKDELTVKRSTSKNEPVKAAKKEEPVKAASKAEPQKEASAWNPMNWFGSSEENNKQQALGQKQSGKAFRQEEALQMQAVHTPAAVQSVKPDKKKLSEKELPKLSKAGSKETTNVVILETEKGNIAVELFPADAPQTVANFKKLVNEEFYNKQGMKFHRVVPGFVVQTGDPTGTGTGGSKDRIPLEVKNKLSHDAIGWVAMARGPDPNSATSQFYITLAAQKSLDGKYAIFGKVVNGYEVLNRIEKDSKLYGVRFADPNKVAVESPPELTESRSWKKWF